MYEHLNLKKKERERDCSQFGQELTRTSNVDSDLAVDTHVGIETKYFHLLFIAGLTCTLSFSSCFAQADFSFLLSNSGESYCQIQFKKLFDNNND